MKKLIVFLILLSGFLSAQTIRYKDLGSEFGRTGFWEDSPLEINPDMDIAFFYTEDFVGVHYDTATAVTIGFEGWVTAGDATYDILSAAGSLGGWNLVAPEAGSNNEFYTQLGALGTETFVEATVGSGKQFWLEYNLTPSSITNAANWFVGLAAEGSAGTTNFIAETGDDFANNDLIFFGIFEGDPNGLQAIWQTTGAAFDTITSGTVDITAVNMTLGFHFDGVTTLEYWKDGVIFATQDISATGFPDTEELTPMIAMKQGASAININIDWIKLISER